VVDSKLKLLVVDDEHDIELLFRQRFRRAVRKGEVELHFARSGVEALAHLEANPEVRIVLSDINMPDMDGLTLLKEVGRLDRVVELVIVSAYGDMDNIRTAMNRGAFDFLTKPLDFKDLDATIEKTVQYVENQLEAQRAQQRAARLAERNQFIRQTFGRYLSDGVVDQLLDHPEGLELGGLRMPLTVLCSDLRGFTAMSDRLPAEEVVGLLNEYFEAMFEVIHRYDGTINAILGDGLLVFFGAPIAMPDAVERALACALDMQKTLAEMRSRPGFPNLEMGIGIHTGAAVVGNIGSKQRSCYSAIGRDVNLATRVESATVGGQILITEETLDAAQSKLKVGGFFTAAFKGVEELVRMCELHAVEGPFAVSWSQPQDPLQVLDVPLKVRFSLLDGKAAGPDSHEGTLVKLSRRRCDLHTDAHIEAFTDLRMVIEGPDGAPLAGDLYAKVLAGESEPQQARLLGFTMIPPDLEAHFEGLLGEAG
jgi:adenylate cyclase